jgi:quercetin dioxygenase-like cupin family protein
MDDQEAFLAPSPDGQPAEHSAAGPRALAEARERADERTYPNVTVGPGYAVGHLDDLGEGYGFRKVRRAFGVNAFGVNALVRQPGYRTKWHYHDEQEELYFVHKGEIEMQFGDGSSHRLREGSFARVDAATVRRIEILGPGDTVYVVAGGKGGYVGYDGKTPEGIE